MSEKKLVEWLKERSVFQTAIALSPKKDAIFFGNKKIIRSFNIEFGVENPPLDLSADIIGDIEGFAYDADQNLILRTTETYFYKFKEINGHIELECQD